MRTGRPRTLPDPLPRPCEVCGIDFTPPRKLQFKQKLCSLKCNYTRFTTAGNAPEPRARAGKSNGEKQRYRGEGKTYIKEGGRHQHRVVAEQMLGRELLPGEIVHHLDGNKRNNDPSNLTVIPSQSDHMKTHRRDLMLGRKDISPEVRERWEKEVCP